MSATADSDNRTPGDRMDQRERMVLYMLHADPFPWTVEELERELGDDTADAVAALAGTGLVHRFDKFVISTRAARRCDELYQGAL